MIVARTKDIDGRFLEALSRGVKQFVFVGVGLDVRAFRLVDPGSDVQVLELDLPGMLAEREKVLASIAGLPPIERRTLPINLEFEDVADVVLSSGQFDPDAPSFVIYEGMSMYFDDEANVRNLGSIHRLMRHPDSRVWGRCRLRRPSSPGGRVSPRSRRSSARWRRSESRSWTGRDDPSRLLRGTLGYTAATVTPSSSCGGLYTADPVYDHYSFYLLQEGPPSRSSDGLSVPAVATEWRGRWQVARRRKIGIGYCEALADLLEDPAGEVGSHHAAEAIRAIEA